LAAEIFKWEIATALAYRIVAGKQFLRWRELEQTKLGG